MESASTATSWARGAAAADRAGASDGPTLGQRLDPVEAALRAIHGWVPTGRVRTWRGDRQLELARGIRRRWTPAGVFHALCAAVRSREPAEPEPEPVAPESAEPAARRVRIAR